MALTADSFKCSVKKITPDTSGVHHSTVLTLVEVWNAVSNGLFYPKSFIFQVLPCLIQKFLWFLGTCRCFEDDFKIKILNFMIQMENPWNPITWRVGDKVWQSRTRKHKLLLVHEKFGLNTKYWKKTHRNHCYFKEKSLKKWCCWRVWSLLDLSTSGLALGDESFWRTLPPFLFLENRVGVVQGTVLEVTGNIMEWN